MESPPRQFFTRILRPRFAVRIDAVMAAGIYRLMSVINLLEELWDRRAPIGIGISSFMGDPTRSLIWISTSSPFPWPTRTLRSLLSSCSGQSFLTQVLGRRADFPWMVLRNSPYICVGFARDARSTRHRDQGIH